MPHRPYTSQDTAKRFAYGIYLTAGIFALVGSLVEAIPLPSYAVVLVAVGTTPAIFLLGVVALDKLWKAQDLINGISQEEVLDEQFVESES